MPTSKLEVFWEALHWVWQVQPKRILDVGPGHGKAGVLFREYIGQPPVGPIEMLDAVEVHQPYVTKRLQCLYDHIYEMDVTKMPLGLLDRYDLVFMSEVIEHIEKDKAKALLGNISGWIVMTTPVQFFHNPPGVPSERHVSHWTKKDFAGPRLDALQVQHSGYIVRWLPRR